MERNLARILIVLYIFFAGWTGAFVIGRYLTIANIILALIMLMMPFSWLKERYSLKHLFLEDFFLIPFLLIITIAAAVNYNGHSLNYIAAYGFVFIAGFLLLKMFFIRYSNHLLLLNAITIALTFHSLIVLIEFFGQTIYGIDIQEYLFKNYPHDAFYSIYPRCFGFTEEPTYFAHFLTTFAPLVFYHIFKSRLWTSVKITLYLIISLSFILTFSTAGFIIIIIGAIISIGVYSFANLSFLKKNWIWLSFLTLLLFFGIFIVFTKEIPALQPLLYKISSSDISHTGSRLNLWTTNFHYLFSHPFWGVGPGYFANQGLTSVVNWYLFLAIEAGLLSLIPLFLFLGFYIYRIFKIDSPYRFSYLYGFITTFIYLFTCSTFYHPYPWLLLIMFSVSIHKSSIKTEHCN